jgi:hypothetical protein
MGYMKAKSSLRKGSIYCLAIWAAIWLMFMLMRFSPLDIRVIPGIGIIMLGALVVALVAPLVSTVLAAVALFRPPREWLTVLTLACAFAVSAGQVLLFTMTRWM